MWRQRNLGKQSTDHKSEILNSPSESPPCGGGPGFEARNKSKILISQCSKRNFADRFIQCFGHSDLENLNVPFDLAQGGESFDFAQDREPVERPVEGHLILAGNQEYPISS